ncbi:SMKI09G1365 [Saccharomyces mikatae IFO 1815]|uniref:SMKI09G1365 protein n=1 Tax=Saccharomyces mikatae IFO 1815 TaxID=226126 RepID=A0AA35J083_SACMI|nr:uncharacterized protein SMKI_09G1365 [Saccharomyces mikatae IFO 1815]CAI4039728.1 SMKI09G1365 [Saccharomyces mikatae IFO 1815]
MQNVKEERSTIRALSKDVVSPPLAVRLTIKAMQILFIGKMFRYSFLPFLPFNLFTFDNSIMWFIAYSVIVSIWGFAVWMERAYRNKINLQPPRCTKIKCSRCKTKKKYPKWFKYKQWMNIFLLYVSLTVFNLAIQTSFFIKEMCVQGVKLPGGREPKCESYPGAIILFEGILVLIHSMTAHVFKEYYLHNGPLETGDRTPSDEKKSASEEAIL